MGFYKKSDKITRLFKKNITDKMGLTTDGYAICEIISCINLKSLWSIV